jgi:hypothetical protein
VRRGLRRYKIKERHPWEETGVDGMVLTEFEDLGLDSPDSG